ncbi:MAG: hypothetical protein JG781_797 [Peptococcaceae bacterium]|jgi:hypothetical protein|nr:hypothetical protein [Peptococcaceae bacterium]
MGVWRIALERDGGPFQIKVKGEALASFLNFFPLPVLSIRNTW